MKKTIQPWDSKAVFSAGFVSFVPCGIVKLKFKFGHFTFVLKNVGVLEKNTVPLILGDDFRDQCDVLFKLKFVRQAGNGCYQFKDTDGVWRCVCSPSKLPMETSFSLSEESSYAGFQRLTNSYNDQFWVFSDPLKDRFDDKDNRKDILNIQYSCFALQDGGGDADFKRFCQKPIMIKYPEVKALILKFEDAFQLHDGPLGRVKNVEHTIDLTTDKPLNQQRSVRNPEDRKFIEDQIHKMLQLGVIEEGISPYNTPILIVRQPLHESQPRRLAFDMRHINKHTVAIPFYMPDIQELLHHLGQGYSYFSSIDFKSAYWQITLREKDRPICAFTTHIGTYIPNVMMFGLNNAPATFQKFVNILVYNINKRIREKKLDAICVGYLDDLSIATKNKEDHFKVLEIVFIACIETGVKISLEKFIALVRELLYLGFIINIFGRRPDPRKMIALVNYPVPTDEHEVRQILGATGHYRKFIANYAMIARPLTNLLCKDVEFIFNEDCVVAFRTLISRLTSHPVLAHYIPGRLTRIYVDASGIGIGCILAQVNEDHLEHIVECASRTLSTAEKKMHSNDVEGIGVHWAITIKYRMYISFDSNVEVYTDNFTFKQALTKINPSHRFIGLVADLQTYTNIKFLHIAGRKNQVADALSRHPVDLEEEHPSCAHIICDPTGLMLEEQSKDPRCLELIKVLSSTTPLPHHEQIKSSYKMLQGILVKKGVYNNNPNYQIVVPHAYRNWIMHAHHDEHGHRNATDTVKLIQKRYFWTGMSADVSKYVKQCMKCALNNRNTSQLISGLLHPREVPLQPFAFCCCDFAGPLDPAPKSPWKHIFLVVDYTTRYLFAHPVTTTSSDEAIRIFETIIFPLVGSFNFLLNDNAKPLRSKKFCDFLQRHGIDKPTLHAYLPQANGLVERYVQTLTSILRKHTGPNLDDWAKFLPKAVFSINNSRQASLRYSPNFLVLGFEPKIPNSGILTQVIEEIDHEERFNRVDSARIAAIDNLYKSQKQQKAMFDKSKRDVEFNIGDNVLYDYHHQHLGKRQKFLPFFEGLFTIINKEGKYNYVIEKIFGPSKVFRRTAHVSQLRLAPLPIADVRPLPTTPLQGTHDFDDDNIVNESTNDPNIDHDVSDHDDQDSTTSEHSIVPPTGLVPPSPIPLVRSSRTKRLPARLKDFVLDSP